MSLWSKILGRLRPRPPMSEYERAIEFRKLGVVVGENVRISGYCHFGSEPYFVEIGDGSILAADVMFITHDGAVNICKQSLGAEVTKFGKIKIGKHCFIGARAIFMPGVTVGDNSVIGAGSVVAHDIPAGEVWAGNPARFVKTVADYAHKVAEICRSPGQAELKAEVRARRGGGAA